MPVRPLTRRDIVLAGLGTASAYAAPGPTSSQAAQLFPNPSACVITPQSIEGPFYFDPALHRADISEGLPGVPLALQFHVVEAGSCSPVANARMDVWHADPLGRYSGYTHQGDSRRVTTAGQTFLRGTQFSDSQGRVTFKTLYPGWYPGRTAHVHFKLFLDRRSVLTGQMYFPDGLSDHIYADVRPYSDRRVRRDTLNTTDAIAQMDPAKAGFCYIKEEPEGYTAALLVGIGRG
ncbi:MAG: intradiol ring-cleavage dioxygenase [Acetobacteraceae bacterium]|nr:intradiol ring-cleavage dioxygenase [Acetobacteraceae bacterium]